MPRGMTTTPSWRSVTKPAQQRLTSRHGRAETHLSRPKTFAISPGCQECPLLRAQCPHSAPQGHWHTYSGLGPRDASVPRQTSLVRETHRPVDRSQEDEEDLPHLAFPLISPKSLLSCPLSEYCPCLGPCLPWRSGAPGTCPVPASEEKV
uniref:Nuclear Testis protein N-terminal domain-containing protein n=1 Tax=Molossus molossus TaxID=27622 RepID=A0A7J8ERN7_MOLMO|nr:hypothetical protein HJG59_008680 [Molossus molossus]